VKTSRFWQREATLLMGKNLIMDNGQIFIGIDYVYLKCSKKVKKMWIVDMVLNGSIRNTAR